MLYEFITAHREEIVALTRDRVLSRPWPSVSNAEIDHGVPLFLTQLCETLRLEGTLTPYASDTIGATAARHGAELLGAGFSVTQVVHDYGDICQAVTEIALAHGAPISIEEFHTLNRCLDTAIAEAVAEHTRLAAQRRSRESVEHLGETAHELRDVLNTAVLAFHTLKRGAVGVNGSTGAVLGRSLAGLRALVDRTLSEVRLTVGKQQRERIAMTTFIDEIAAAGMLHADDRQIRFLVGAVAPGLAVCGDAQLLGSALMNLLHNAFKNTPANGTVSVRVKTAGPRVRIEIEDECGGWPAGEEDPFQRFGNRRGRDRSGLGLGLSIARQAVRAHDGEIIVRNLPGSGCVFTVDLALAEEAGALDAVPVALRKACGHDEATNGGLPPAGGPQERS